MNKVEVGVNLHFLHLNLFNPKNCKDKDRSIGIENLAKNNDNAFPCQYSANTAD